MLHARIAARAFNTPLLVEPTKAMAFLSGLGPRIIGRAVEQTDSGTVVSDAAMRPARTRIPDPNLASIFINFIFTFLCSLRDFLFKSQGALKAQRSVFSLEIVEPIEVLEDGSLCMPHCVPSLSPDQFSLQGFEEGCRDSIIPAVAFTAHRDV